MNFLQHFESLEDPRSTINRKHELLDILFLTIAAVLSGAEGWKEIHEFGILKLKWLRKFRPFAAGIPVDDTIARVISALDAECFLRCFISWVNEVRGSVGQDQIVIDGKTLRRSFKGTRSTAIHMINAWSKRDGLVLSQRRSSGKKNENHGVLETLDILNVKGALVSVDAMNSQRGIAAKLNSKQADYLLCIKRNQRRLLEEIQAAFHRARRENSLYIKEHFHEEVDSGHGRIENRRTTQLPIDSWFTEAQRWPGAASVVEVTRERHIKDKVERQTNYYLSSLQPDAAAVANAVRSHWEVENKLHWVLDVTFREDDSRIRRQNAAENMAAARRFVMNLVRINTVKNSVKGKLRQASWSDDFREQVLFG